MKIVKISTMPAVPSGERKAPKLLINPLSGDVTGSVGCTQTGFALVPGGNGSSFVGGPIAPVTLPVALLRTSLALVRVAGAEAGCVAASGCVVALATCVLTSSTVLKSLSMTPPCFG